LAVLMEEKKKRVPLARWGRGDEKMGKRESYWKKGAPIFDDKGKRMTLLPKQGRRGEGGHEVASGKWGEKDIPNAPFNGKTGFMSVLRKKREGTLHEWEEGRWIHEGKT